MKFQDDDSTNTKLAKLSPFNNKSEIHINSCAHRRCCSNRIGAMMRVAPLCHLLVLLATSSVAVQFWANNQESTNEVEFVATNPITNDNHRIFEYQNSRFKRHPKSSDALPEFSAPIGNVTAVLGRDVRLICQVENLGQYQVAWLKEETKTIISIDTNIIITNYRIFLIPDEEEKRWALHIKDVQESDRGFYQCQVNTNPMRSISGYLDVVVPPSIIQSQTSQMLEVLEHSNATIQCQAHGHPKPSVVWRRDDGLPIRLSGNFDSTAKASDTSQSDHSSQYSALTQLNDVKSDRLTLQYVDRSMAGIYVCTASNGIPTPAIKRIPIYVKFPPKTSVQNKFLSVHLGEKVEIECSIEAFPMPNAYWTKRSPNQLNRGDRWSQLQTHHRLQSAGAISYHASDLLVPIEPSTSSSIDKDIAVSQSSRDVAELESPTRESLNKPDDDIRHTTLLGHPHNNRIRYRQAMDKMRPNFDKTIANKERITVGQVSLNSYSFKLTLTIESLQIGDYGEYACLASNSLDKSESKVVIITPNRAANMLNLDEREISDDQRSVRHPQSTNFRRNSTGHRVVYDENYLQTIRTRQSQNPPTNPNKLQLNKSKHYERNSGAQIMSLLTATWIVCLLAISNAIYTYSCSL